jgi:hypothetical protein
VQALLALLSGSEPPAITIAAVTLYHAWQWTTWPLRYADQLCMEVTALHALRSACTASTKAPCLGCRSC